MHTHKISTCPVLFNKFHEKKREREEENDAGVKTFKGHITICMQSPRFEFGLDKPTVKDISGDKQGTFSYRLAFR